MLHGHCCWCGRGLKRDTIRSQGQRSSEWRPERRLIAARAKLNILSLNLGISAEMNYNAHKKT